LHAIELKTYEKLDKSKNYVLLDVRNLKEWEDQVTFEESLLISLSKLKEEISQVEKFLSANKGKQSVVNCKTGFRARFAISILLKHGIHAVVLNENLDNLIKKRFKMTEFKG
jgi:rhodanese-related sulfurtransferase